ncbi:MAG: translation elongation factor Ts [Chitinophagales bacterium]
MSGVKITAAEVNKLRKQTGAGMMDCKKALKEAEGDFDAAITILRKKGQKVAAKRSDREATEGVAVAKVSDDGTQGISLVLSCETDFVAKNADFVSFANDIADLALANMPADNAELATLPFNGSTVAENLIDQIGKIGEKIEVSQYEKLEGALVVPYIHAGNKIGVLVGLNQEGNDEIVAAGKDVAMQVAAMKPIAVDENSIDEATKQKEMEIGREQARASGRPEHILDRIAEGKLKKFYQENTLVHQKFVKDNSKSVKDYLNSVSKGLKVENFKRLSIG